MFKTKWDVLAAVAIVLILVFVFRGCFGDKTFTVEQMADKKGAQVGERNKTYTGDGNADFSVLRVNKFKTVKKQSEILDNCIVFELNTDYEKMEYFLKQYADFIAYTNKNQGVSNSNIYITEGYDVIKGNIVYTIVQYDKDIGDVEYITIDKLHGDSEKIIFEMNESFSRELVILEAK